MWDLQDPLQPLRRHLRSRNSYNIQHFLKEIRYEEGSDVTQFFLDIEQAIKVTDDAPNSVMNDEQKSIYLYHAMPSERESSLVICKGNL